MRRATSRLIVCALAAPIAALMSRPVQACDLSSGPERTVARVIAADTLQLDDGTRVRLANLAVPRAADLGLAAASPSQTQAVAAVESLVLGKSVRLRFDTARTDRYGIARAHVWLVNAAPARGSAWLQARMLEQGHARLDARHGERACIADLLAFEMAARAADRGLWSERAYRVRNAAAPRDLAAYRGTFQIVAGVVHSTERFRDVVRLVLGPDRRRALTVSLRANDRDLLGAIGGDARAIVGRSIEARGWIDRRPGAFSGPDIDVSLAGHVRLIAAAR